MNYIDLFSGAGGLTLGFQKSKLKFKSLLAIEIAKDFAKTYSANFPNHNLLIENICDIDEIKLSKYINDETIDLVVGGPPCQGFSMAGNIGRKFIDDPRNHLFKEFVRIVKITKPKFFVLENVARLYIHNNGATRKEIITAFEELGYSVDCKVVNTKFFGIPQERNRVLFIGNNLGIQNIFPKQTIMNDQFASVVSAIGDLPPLSSGESCNNFRNHAAMKHSEQMLKKMSFVKDGGTRLDIPEKYRPKTGDIRKYIRYNSQKPSICITGDMRKVFHPTQNRALTVRELARLQSFPDDFIFCGSTISQQQQIGNAVPPSLATAIANSIHEMSLVSSLKEKRKMQYA